MSYKKVSFVNYNDTYNEINKKPCICQGCDNCSVKNHHCNLFTPTKCNICKENICSNCLINNNCIDCSKENHNLPDYMNNLLH
jgi:hypothetical protein